MTKQELLAQLEQKLAVVKERQFVVEGRSDAVVKMQAQLDELQATFDVQADRLEDKELRAIRHLEEIDELETEEHVVPTAKVASMLKFAQLK